MNLEIKKLEQELREEFCELYASNSDGVVEINGKDEVAKSCASITIQFFLENTKHLTTFEELQDKIKEIENARNMVSNSGL